MANNDKQVDDSDDSDDTKMAPMDFSTFVLSMASSAMVGLGLVSGPDDETPSRDLNAAKQVIDILDVLEKKTHGNLTETEDKLLHSLLYDLRIKFCEIQKA